MLHKIIDSIMNHAQSYLALSLGALIFAIGISFDAALAAPPHPDLKARIESGEIEVPPFLKNYNELRAQGVCDVCISNAPGKLLKNNTSGASAQTSSAVTVFRALAILVDFSDQTSSVSSIFFDTMLFDTKAGTMRDYYSEISYGQLDLVTVNLPSTLGWTRAPQTYAYYTDAQNGTGTYPQNTQGLTENLVDAIDAVVDFSQYDNDSDGFVDVLTIVHTGPGAEFTGSPNDIWSHKWAISPRLKDGVWINDFTIQPEYWSAPGDLTIGVYAHELGHGFGLTDLYDTDNSSWGNGRWSLMASGSWNGPGSLGSSPAHPDSWSRIKMGLATSTNITTNINGFSLPSVESGSNIYRMWTGGGASAEYFLVENRQRTGYDSYLPGDGLLIWHVDESKSNNTAEWYPGNSGSGNYMVALEQADGLWNLEKKVDLGSVADPFSINTGATDFSPSSTPNSNAYSGVTTFVAVQNVSASGGTMTADLSVSLVSGLGDPDPTLPDNFELYQNYPNPFNPTTNISFNLPKTGQVTVTVYNSLGQIVDVIADGILPAGDNVVVWDGSNKYGNSVSSGIYFYEVSTEEFRDSRKMTLAK